MPIYSNCIYCSVVTFFTQLLSLTEEELQRMNITVSNVSILNEDLDMQIDNFLVCVTAL